MTNTLNPWTLNALNCCNTYILKESPDVCKCIFFTHQVQYPQIMGVLLKCGRISSSSETSARKAKKVAPTSKKILETSPIPRMADICYILQRHKHNFGRNTTVPLYIPVAFFSPTLSHRPLMYIIRSPRFDEKEQLRISLFYKSIYKISL